MDVDAQVHHWFSSAQSDLDTADILADEFRSFDCLLACHSCIGMLFKGIWVARKKAHPPVTNNLLWLAKEVELDLDDEHLSLIYDLTMVTRKHEWPDEMKRLRRTLPKETGQQYLARTEGLVLWLKGILTR